MLACLPTINGSGLEDVINDHFGSAPYFTLYNSDTEEVKIINNRNVHHDHGTCHPMNTLNRYNLDAVICLAMGRRAIMALNGEGIKIYQAESKKVKEVVEKVKSGELVEMDPTKACMGHGHSHAGHCGGPQPGRGSGYGQGRGIGHGQGSSGGAGRGPGGENVD